MKPITRFVVIIVAVFFAWQMSRPVIKLPECLILPIEPWKKYFLMAMIIAFGVIALYNIIKFFVGWREDYD